MSSISMSLPYVARAGAREQQRTTGVRVQEEWYDRMGDATEMGRAPVQGLPRCMPTQAWGAGQVGAAFWATGGGPTGTTEVMDTEINSDPVMRVCQRCDSIEHEPGVIDRDGKRVVLDEAERRRLRDGGTREAWRARRVLANIRMGHWVRWCAFTDASKGKHGVGGGVWEGVQEEKGCKRLTGLAARMQQRRRETGRGEGTAKMERRAVGEGLWGEKLPDKWEVYDAEMYMIVRYLREVAHRLAEGTEEGDTGDAVVVSDSLSALLELEHAWRAGEVGLNVRSATMLEAACRLRSMLCERWGVEVVCVWCPGHRIPYNSYADAVAKVSCTKVRTDTTRWLVELTRGRTCAYATQAGAHMELCNGTVHREARRGMREWVRARAGATGADGGWSEVVAAVSRGCARRGKTKRREKDDGAESGEEDGWGEEDGEREREQRTVLERQQVTYAIREGNAAWAEHGRAWERWWDADVTRGAVTKVTIQGMRTCTACSASRCTVMHVCVGACMGITRRGKYVEALLGAVERVAAVLPKVVKGEVCRAHAQVRRAIAALRQQLVCIEAGEAGPDTGEGVSALRDLLAGRLDEPSGVKGQGSAERRAVAWRVAAAIGKAQDEVTRMVVRYSGDLRERWAAVRAEVDEEWEVECARKVSEERELREERERCVQAAIQRRRDAAEAAALRAAMAERARRDEARAGAGAAITRCMTAVGAELVAGMGEDAVPRATQRRREITGSDTAVEIREADSAMRAQEAAAEYERARLRRRGYPCVGSDTAAMLWEMEQGMLRDAEVLEPQERVSERGGERMTGDQEGAARRVDGGTRDDAIHQGRRGPRKRQKTVVRVSSMHDATRWRREEREGGGGVYYYRDEDNIERPRYEVRESEMMHAVLDGASRSGGMQGLYAARRYEQGEVITVYVGEMIGRVGAGGEEELERRVAAGGGRHVMALSGGALMDGVKGYTGAQYINSAYRVPSTWWNNATFASTGTVTATQVIPEGREILMAYHGAYWKRWGVAAPKEKKKGRLSKRADGDAWCSAGTAPAVGGMADDDDGLPTRPPEQLTMPADACSAMSEAAGSSGSSPLLHLPGQRQQAQHAGRVGGRVTVSGSGVRVAPSGTPGGRGGRGKRRRGAEESDMLEEESDVVKRRRADGRWTPTMYDAFVQRVVRRERGEGGGVT